MSLPLTSYSDYTTQVLLCGSLKHKLQVATLHEIMCIHTIERILKQFTIDRDS